MPKNPWQSHLNRWIDADERLVRRSLVVREMASYYSVSEKTIKRDLAAFRALGMRIERRYWRDPGYRRGDHFYGYAKDQRPLFTRHTTITVRELLLALVMLLPRRRNLINPN